MIIPPILPMAMVWSLHWANYRLRHDHKVYCAYPSLIVVAGGTNCVCFDKVPHRTVPYRTALYITLALNVATGPLSEFHPVDISFGELEHYQWSLISALPLPDAAEPKPNAKRSIVDNRN